jgi:drug/metabolite transporter (DMT)-like permease
MKKARQSYFFAGLAILSWSTIPTAFKIGLGELSVLPMLTIASIVSSLILFFIILTEKKLSLLRKMSTRDLISSSALGLINPFLYYLILLKAYQLLPAQVAQPLNMIWPIVTVFLSALLLGQKISTKSYGTLFISFAGVYLISSQGHPFSPGRSDTTGVVLAMTSSIFWALYFILNVKDKRDESVKLFTNFIFATFYLIIAFIIKGSIHESFSTKGVLTSVYTGVFEMGIGFFFWLKALQLAPSTDKVSNLVFFGPFLSLIFVHFFLHEHVYYTTPAGLLLIISGIFIQNRKTKQSV